MAGNHHQSSAKADPAGLFAPGLDFTRPQRPKPLAVGPCNKDCHISGSILFPFMESSWKAAFVNKRSTNLFFPHELQSAFSTEFDGHGFLIRDYIRDYTKLGEGPLASTIKDF